MGAGGQAEGCAWDPGHLAGSPCNGGSFSGPGIARKPKNVQTTVRLRSFHMLVRSCSESSKLGFSST